jgi:hypothetical protein
MKILLRFLLTLFIFLGVISSQSLLAEDLQFKADEAVANILFDYDGAEEFASYVIDDNGFVDITFASNTPDDLYITIVKRMNDHPDIDGVLSGKSGPVCPLF